MSMGVAVRMYTMTAGTPTVAMRVYMDMMTHMHMDLGMDVGMVTGMHAR